MNFIGMNCYEFSLRLKNPVKIYVKFSMYFIFQCFDARAHHIIEPVALHQCVHILRSKKQNTKKIISPEIIKIFLMSKCFIYSGSDHFHELAITAPP